jgi:hypothetical protein
MSLWVPKNAMKLSCSFITGGLSSSVQLHRISYLIRFIRHFNIQLMTALYWSLLHTLVSYIITVFTSLLVVVSNSGHSPLGSHTAPMPQSQKLSDDWLPVSRLFLLTTSWNGLHKKHCSLLLYLLAAIQTCLFQWFVSHSLPIIKWMSHKYICVGWN